MPTPTIATRVQRVERIATAYASASGTVPEAVITDVLADMLHYCDAYGVGFAACLMRAQGHFTVEQIEDVRRH